MGLQVKKDDIYGNYSIVHPDGSLMCHTDRKKVNWYIKKNLAVWVNDNTIQLTFQPKGHGNIGDSEYYAESRQNICVVCGCQDGLTLHHVVPYQYRKHFPDHLKSHTSFDILPLCITHHEDYEDEAAKRNKRLQVQYNALPGINKLPEDVRIAKEVAGFISTLNKAGDQIPEARRLQLLGKVREYFNTDDIWWDDLTDLLVEVQYKVEASSPAKTIVESVPDILQFIIGWRHHFIDTMKPRFISEKWIADMERVAR